MNNCPLTAGAELRIMTSNCLFDATAAERSPLLRDNYAYYLPDLLGLQEINKVLHESLIPIVRELGYAAVKAWPDPDKMTDEEKQSICKTYPKVNFFPILYRTDRFAEVESGFTMYRSTFTITKGFTWAVFRRISDGRLLAHINTHCSLVLKQYGLDQPDSVLGNEWRCDNMRQLLAMRDVIREKYGDIPVFMTGDFNDGEDSGFYRAITGGGMLNVKYSAEVSAVHNQHSFHQVGVMPKTGADTLPIDHIFVTPGNVRVLRHSIGLRPEVINASDHCMVFADVALV